jgi:hypothetical protein
MAIWHTLIEDDDDEDPYSDWYYADYNSPEGEGWHDRLTGLPVGDIDDDLDIFDDTANIPDIFPFEDEDEKN